MKNIKIIIVLALLSVITANAQKSANYISLANSNNNSGQYLMTNFLGQKTKYIGQPLSLIFNDLELKILNHSAIDRINPGMTGTDKRYIAGIAFGFYNINEFKKKTNVERAQMKFYVLKVYTKELLLRSVYETLLFKDPINCDADIKALYNSNSYIVDRIEVVTAYN